MTADSTCRLNSFVLVQAENKRNHSCFTWASSVQQNFLRKSNTLILQILDLRSRNKRTTVFPTWRPACVPMLSWIAPISILTSNHHTRPFSTGPFNWWFMLGKWCCRRQNVVVRFYNAFFMEQVIVLYLIALNLFKPTCINMLSQWK